MKHDELLPPLDTDDPSTDTKNNAILRNAMDEAARNDPTRFTTRSFAVLENKDHSLRLINREDARKAISIPWDELSALRAIIDVATQNTTVAAPPETPVVASKIADEVVSELFHIGEDEIGTKGRSREWVANLVAAIITRYLGATPTVASALNDLFALFEKDKAGRWNFNSLSRDASKLDRIMDRLSAATTPLSETAVGGKAERRSNHFSNAAIDKGFPAHIGRDNKAHYSDGTVLPAAGDNEGKRKMYDDSQPAHAALSMLIDDGYATDKQRQTARLALALIENHEDELDKELRRWQDGIHDKLIALGAPDHLIDGAGCDSGDPLDFSLAEIGQGVGYFIDQLEEIKKGNTND